MSDWTHSRYVRHLADAAFGGRPVRIDLSVRRLYCENGACPKVTFAERVPGLTVRYQRRTPLLQQLVKSVGAVLCCAGWSGRGGARRLRVLNVRLSRCTVLAQLMRVPLPPVETPRALGVDGFALYGGIYGTLLVDANTRLPLTLWEGRDAEQLSHWLREHPGIEVACVWLAGAYWLTARGMTVGGAAFGGQEAAVSAGNGARATCRPRGPQSNGVHRVSVTRTGGVELRELR